MTATIPGTCYLLCIRPAYFHARHYAGWTVDPDPTRRVGEHLDVEACRRAGRHLPGHRGSPLVCAALRAGRAVVPVLSVPGERGLERRWHHRHGTRVCPACKHGPRPRPRQLRLPIRKGGPRRASPLPLWRLAHAA